MTDHYDILDTASLHGNWNYPTQIKFGPGRIKELPDLCRESGLERPLIVTDAGLAELEFVQQIQQHCRSEGLFCELFSEVKPNPTGSNIAQGVAAYQQGNHDGVIALGGGSGLDAAKAVALMVGQHRPLWDFEDSGDNWLRVRAQGMAATIAVPTTSGTGSEVGRASVIVDEQQQLKKIIYHPKMLPHLVVADPALTCGLAPHITAATGLDAFVHCLEAWCAPGFHPMADGIALEGMRLIKDWLPKAYEDGDDVIARSYMMIASSMGATAFQKGLGGIHALAHPLGAIYDKHHGLLNAILMPYVLKRNEQKIKGRIEHLANYLGIGSGHFTDFMDWILALRDTLKIPHNLQAIGLQLENSAKIGELAYSDPSAAGNPVALSPQDYSAIFARAVTGSL